MKFRLSIALVSVLLLTTETYAKAAQQFETQDTLMIDSIVVKVIGALPYSSQSSVRYCGGKPCQGEIIDTFPNGLIRLKAFYINGKEHGEEVSYYESGKIWSIGELDSGERVGKWVFFDDSIGEIEEEHFYRKGWGEPIKWVGYYENGRINSLMWFNEQDSTWTWETYYKNGQMEWYAQSNEFTNIFVEYEFSETGDTLFALYPIDYEKKLYAFWRKNKDGKIIETGQGVYSKNNYLRERVGTWKWFDDKGVLIRTEEYGEIED